MAGTHESITLVGIPYSHYNERARWALQRCGINFIHVKAMPLIHMPIVRYYHWKVGYAPAKTSGTKTSSPLGTPFTFITDAQGRTTILPDSTAVVAYCDKVLSARGLPTLLDESPEHDAFVQTCHDRLGIAVRSISYLYLLPSYQMTLLGWRNGAGMVQSSLWALMWPLARIILTSAFGLKEERVPKWEASIREVYEQASAILTQQEERARRAGTDATKVYMFGDRFTCADLTFACLGGVILGIPAAHTDGWLPPIASFASADSRLSVLSSWAQGTKAGQHILRMYREERWRVAA